jgi:hypothetical protein
LEAGDEQKEGAEDQSGESGESREPVLPLAEQARLHMALGAAYQGRESAKRSVGETVAANFMCAASEYQLAVDLWRVIISEAKEGSSGNAATENTRIALAESLKGVGHNCSLCTNPGTAGYALNPHQQKGMAERAAEVNAEALAVYEELQLPELGEMYKVIGTMYLGRYRATAGYRWNSSSGPQHGELGDKAIEYYRKGAETFVRMGLDQVDSKGYGACLSNLATGMRRVAFCRGLLLSVHVLQKALLCLTCCLHTHTAYQDRGDQAQALPCYLAAAINGETILGREHPTVAKRRNNLVNVLRSLGRLAEAGAVAAGNELLEGGGATVVAF